MAENSSTSPATAGNTSITGTSGVDSLSGGGGNDTIVGGGGADRLSGDAPLPGQWQFSVYTRDFTSANNQTQFITSGTLVGHGYVDDFGVRALRNTLSGQPAGNDQNDYGIIYRSNLAITSSGPYTFSTTSDDGSRIIIRDSGGNIVFNLDNDFHQAPFTRSGTVTLTAGQTYSIEVLYWENQGGDILSGTIAGPGFAATDLATSSLLQTPPLAPGHVDGDDSILGEAGDDTITGGGGNDRLYGGADNDSILGETGQDTILGGTGDDRLYGGDNNDSILGEAGQDTILGGTGDDRLYGGDNNDSILGEAGQDTILGGTGDDRLYGGDENDSVLGEAGRDILFGDTGDDQLFGGADADTIDGGAGNDTIDSGTGDDSVEGGTGNDQILFGADNDTVYGGAGNDLIDDVSGDQLLGRNLIYGGADDDRIWSGSDVDTVFGDSGNDTISGEAGNDLIQGGTGSDALSGGDDRDRFTMLDGDFSVGDQVDGGEGGDDFDTLDLTGYGWSRVQISYSTPDRENGTIAFFDTVGNPLGTMSFSNIEEIIPCFTAGTLVETPDGPRLVETIQPGDLVMTLDDGPQVVRWVGQRTLGLAELVASPDLRPVEIEAGSMGSGIPARTLAVSPQHRVLFGGAECALYFGEDEVLAPAVHLLGLAGVRRCLRPVTYVHLMFDRHQIVQVEGLWSESFQPGDRVLGAMTDPQREELYRIFPALAEGAAYPAARATLNARETRVLLASGQ